MNDKIQNDTIVSLNTIKFIILVLTFLIGGTIGIFKVFATNERVNKIESKTINNKNILCELAIDLNGKKAMKACEQKK